MPAPAMAHTQNQITTSSVQLAFQRAQVRLDATAFDQFPKFSVHEVGNLCFNLFVGKRQIDHNSIPCNRVTGGSLVASPAFAPATEVVERARNASD